jgi:hypothetical protein
VQTPAGENGKRGETRVTVDGIEQGNQPIALIDDHREHTVEVCVPAQ